MKLASFVTVTAFSLGWFCAPAQAASCPADPVKASADVWKMGTLYSWGDNNVNGEMTGTHPCGSKLACRPGNPHRSLPRVCHWL
jgi:hypothetical protein